MPLKSRMAEAIVSVMWEEDVTSSSYIRHLFSLTSRVCRGLVSISHSASMALLDNNTFAVANLKKG